MNLRDYLDFVIRAKSLEELWPAHVEQMAQYGFDRIIYGHTRFKTDTSLGDPEDFLILTNHDNAYLNGFLDQGLYFHAPMVQWALKNEGACSWNEAQKMLGKNELSPEAIQVLEFNSKLKMKSGYTISFHSSNKRFKGAVSLAGEPSLSQDDVDALWKTHGRDLELMNNIAHLKITSMPYVPPNRALTKRQREALEWVGDGKTTQDIAMLLGLTTATVDKHLRLARESLSVETTAQAVLKAALHNQIFMSEA